MINENPPGSVQPAAPHTLDLTMKIAHGKFTERDILKAVGRPVENLMENSDADRIDREREYHNSRFTDETRVHQDKFYWALRDLEQWYETSVKKAADHADVLEYGCAKGEWSVNIAGHAKNLVGIDISDVAIEAATDRTNALNFNNCKFMVMNAEELEFEDNAFDVVFGSGILHHLDIDKCYAQIHRVLRPGGIAIFKEPLGHNVLINLYRTVTPSARTPDEHPLLKADLDKAQAVFGRVDLEFYGLTTLAAVPFRHSGLGRIIFAAASQLDRLLLRIPAMKWQFWYVSIVLRKAA